MLILLVLVCRNTAEFPGLKWCFSKTSRSVSFPTITTDLVKVILDADNAIL